MLRNARHAVQWAALSGRISSATDQSLQLQATGAALRGLKQQALHDACSLSPLGMSRSSTWGCDGTYDIPFVASSPTLDLSSTSPAEDLTFVAYSSIETLMLFMSPTQLGAQVRF